LKGSLCGSGQLLRVSIRKRDPQIFLFESRSNRDFAVSKDFAVSQRFCCFEIQQENLWVTFLKVTTKSYPDPQRLPFKGSILLQNLVGPGYLELLAKSYGVATISRLLKMIGLFCKRAL
jgi:hypothetical protein